MFYYNTLNLIQVGGGTQVKQGDLGSKFSYKLANEKDQELDDFDKEVAHIDLVLNDKIVFTTTATVDNSTVTFNIDKPIPVGLYFLEIKIRDYIFPSDKQTIIFVQSGAVAYDLKELVPNYDTNMTIKSILSDLSQKGIDIKELNRQLAEKANKDEVTNVMTPKGTLAYASLPTSGNQVGWYYYCPDGDGVHGAGNYVWNGTSWYFGGTGNEGYNLLKKDLVNNFIYKKVLIEPVKYYDNGYISADTGEVVSHEHFKYTDYIPIPITFSKIELYSVYTNGGAFYDSNKQYISGIKTETDILEPIAFNVPSNAKYVRYNVHRYSQDKSCYGLESYLKTTSRIYEYINQELSLNKFNRDNIFYGYLYEKHDGNIIKRYDKIFLQSNVIRVNAGDKLILYGFTPNKDIFWLSHLIDEDVNNIKNISDTVKITPTKSINGLSYAEYIVPESVNLISVAGLKHFADKSYIELIKHESKIRKYIINCLGDSITEGYIKTSNGVATFANPTWCETVKNNLDCVVNNYGVSATSICSGSSESFVERLNRMTEQNIDMLFIFGGTNDYGDNRAVTLGNISDNPSQGNNFYASYKYLIEKSIKKYPNAIIAIVTPMRRQYGDANMHGISIDDIVNAEIEIANYYGLPCLDFYNDGVINPAIKTYREKFTSDGLHPNQLGIDTFLAPKFSSFINECIKYRPYYF